MSKSQAEKKKECLETIGGRLKAERTRRGKSQLVCSFEFGLSREAWKNYEINRNAISTDLLIKLHTQWGMDLNELLAGDKSRKNQAMMPMDVKEAFYKIWNYLREKYGL